MYGLLTGVRVLELGQFILAPFCAQILGDLGAEVIKIEKINGGDAARDNGPWDKKTGKALYYSCFNRNKKSIAINFRTDEGKEMIKKLAAESDVFISNLRVGTLAKMGLSYETLKEVNPKLIMLSGSGYGQTGPEAERVAFDQIISYMGHWYKKMPDGSYTHGVGYPTDAFTALYAAISILSALRYRDQTGKGMNIDLAMIGAILNMQSFNMANYAANQEEEVLPDSAPWGSFRTKDGAVNINASTAAMYPRLKKAVNIELLDRPQYDLQENRCRDFDLLAGAIEEWTMQHTSDEVDAIMKEAGVPCGKARSWKEIFEDKQLEHRNFFVPVEVNGIGELKFAAFPAIFEGMPYEKDQHAPDLGENSVDIMKNILGMNDGEIEKLPWQVNEKEILS